MKGTGSGTPAWRHVLTVFILGVLLFGSLLFALPQDNIQRIDFAHSTGAVPIKGSVKGYDSRRYLVHLESGAIVGVALRSSNPSTYFNIFSPGSTPGAAEALYASSLQGRETQFTAKEAGDYLIEVYLFRNAARRGAKSEYLLTVRPAR